MSAYTADMAREDAAFWDWRRENAGLEKRLRGKFLDQVLGQGGDGRWRCDGVEGSWATELSAIRAIREQGIYAPVDAQLWHLWLHRNDPPPPPAVVGVGGTYFEIWEAA